MLRRKTYSRTKGMNGDGVGVLVRLKKGMESWMRGQDLNKNGKSYVD